MTTPPLQLEWPALQVFDSDATERELSEWYAHPAGTWRLGLIRSADGRLWGPDGSSRSLSSPADLRVMRALRVAADAVVVGGVTARTEGYRSPLLGSSLSQTRLDLGLSPQPVVVVVTATGDVPDSCDPEHTVIATLPEVAIRSAWTRVVRFANWDALRAEVSHIGEGRVLCEGGGHLAWALHHAGTFAEWCLTTSPRAGDPLATPCPEPPEDAQLVSRLTHDGFVMERWALPSSP